MHLRKSASAFRSARFLRAPRRCTIVLDHLEHGIFGSLRAQRRCTTLIFHLLPAERGPSRTRRCPGSQMGGWSGDSVPPRTRRCTRDAQLLLDGVGGSSAHAEMHPDQEQRTAPAGRFLRARGDAPLPEVFGPRTPRVPPRTRRCTRPGGHGRHLQSGPSARGRYTVIRSAKVVLSAVPPRTRRCTPGPALTGRELAGSSAHAEMHPGDSLARMKSSRFLRARGDAPTTGSDLFAQI